MLIEGKAPERDAERDGHGKGYASSPRHRQAPHRFCSARIRP